MNYQKHYDAIIARSKCRLLEGYSENTTLFHVVWMELMMLIISLP